MVVKCGDSEARCMECSTFALVPFINHTTLHVLHTAVAAIRADEKLGVLWLRGTCPMLRDRRKILPQTNLKHLVLEYLIGQIFLTFVEMSQLARKLSFFFFIIVLSLSKLETKCRRTCIATWTN